MTRVIVTVGAAAGQVTGLERYREFLTTKNKAVAARAGQAISQQFTVLETNPDIGRPYLDSPMLRERLISFGDSGYVALYRYEATKGVAYVLAFRHQREAGY